MEPHYGDLLSQGLGIHEVLKMHLFPITNIHLSPSPNWEIEAIGNKASVYIFSSIAVMILIIACINFMNLSTARAHKRAKEVSLRKTVGASKSNLRVQFIQESLHLAIFALALALLLIGFFIPAYNKIFNEHMTLSSLFHLKNILLLIGITLVVGLFAGLYPAFHLTKFEPIGVLRGGSLLGRGKSGFRRNMVIIQFIISIALIVGTLTVHKQMRYIQTRSLGFDKENVLLIPVRSQQVRQHYDAFRKELLISSSIKSMAVSSDLPGETFYSNTAFTSREHAEEPVNLIVLMTDYDFVDTYGMDVCVGRAFSREFSADTEGAIILNEAAVRRFGWNPQEAVNKELSYFGGENLKIVGVVTDFNYRSLHTEIEPIALILAPNTISAISIRILPGNIEKTIGLIEEKWKDTFPGDLFEFSFLDDRINQLYESEKKVANVFTIFSCFSLFVACLGLFGLAAFTTAERTKEIGIRKVLGASTGNLLLLLSKEFIICVVIANIITWPVAWYIMNKWLQNFAYKANIGWSIFLLSGIIALVIALLTFSFQAIKAANTNPVNSLRYE